ARFTPGRADLRAALAERIGPDVIPTILDAGYGFDCFDDGTVDTALRYKIIVLPGVETIPVATLRKLDEFRRAGGKVIATRRLPDKAPGFKATAADHQEV